MNERLTMVSRNFFTSSCAFFSLMYSPMLFLTPALLASYFFIPSSVDMKI